MLSNNSAFHWWSTQSATLPLLLSFELMSCAAYTNGCLDLRRRACPPNGRVSAEWRRCSGSMSRCARDNVAPLRRSSAGWMPAGTGRLSAGVGRRHAVTSRKASLKVGSMRLVWTLRHHTVEQYSAVEWTRPGWLFAVLLLQHPSQSQQAASGVRRVMSSFCEGTRGVDDTWATCPTLLRGFRFRSRRAGFPWQRRLLDHV